jgi:DNA-binding transcriptional regulator YdaS (Cro superfamily)
MSNNRRMNLTTWTNAERRRSLALAHAIGVTAPVVSDWSTGKKAVPIGRCVAIERATQGAVTRRDLRPHDWQEIWPELAATHANAGECATCSVAEQGA